MIKVKNSQLDSQTLEVINKFIDNEIKASAAFKLSRIIKDISSIIEDKIKHEQKILEKWCEKDADGNVVVPKDADGNAIANSVKISDMNAFNKEMHDLMSVETEINHTKLNFDELGLETASVKDIIKIDFLFE